MVAPEIAARSMTRSSVAHVRDDWYVVCASSELRDKPRPFVLYGTPLVAFRGSGRAPAVLLDRCPHRNAPLSLGHVRKDGALECAYHGWRFDGAGQCTHVPGLRPDATSRGRGAPHHACREQDGWIWVYGTPDVEPAREPFRIPFANDSKYLVVRRSLRAEGTLHATAENALDVPHTAFLHGGLFRSDARPRTEIQVVVRTWHDRVEAEYVGESAPTGLAGRILAPNGGVVEHFDRFILPCVIQVEYRLGAESHLLVTGLLTPEADHVTRLHATVCFRSPMPSWLVRPIVQPIAVGIFAQDARMLRRQTESIRRFGSEDYTSTEIDVLGPAIHRLLRAAERGERDPLPEPTEKRLVMHV